MSQLEVKEIPRGKGAEGRVHDRIHDEESARLAPPTVIKIFRRFAYLWQTIRADYFRKCIRSILENDFLIPDIQVHENKRVKIGNTYKSVKVALEAPLDRHIDEKQLTYEDLTDPMEGPQLLRELIRYVHAADKARETDEIGYDPVGGEFMVDAIKGLFQRIILTLASVLPESIEETIDDRIPGIQGKVRNISKEYTEKGPALKITDIGCHDFSGRGKFKFITGPVHELSFGGLIQLIKGCNEELPEEVRIPASEIDNLPYAKSFATKYPAKILWAIMEPLFKRHKERTRQVVAD